MKSIQHEKIGTTDQICPNCKITLVKFPNRKTKCKNCGNYFYVRTRPADKQKVILTEEEAVVLEKQWEIQRENDLFKRNYEEVKDVFDTIKSKLTKQYGREPLDNDVLWATYNQLLIKHAEVFNWGFYRNIKFRMAELLIKEKRKEHALKFLLELCYLDLNGPNNCGKIDWEIFKLFPPFNAEFSSLAPGILDLVKVLKEELNLSKLDLQNKFIEYSNKLYLDLKILPLNSDAAWLKLEKEI